MNKSVTRSAWMKGLLGIAISSWAVYLCVTRFDWGEVWQQILSVEVDVFALAVVCYLAGFIFRAWRASMMLEAMCEPTMRNSLAVVAIGYAGNNLLPFRMGELMRSDAAARIYGIHRGSAVVQVAAERILDAMAIIALLLVSVLFVSFEGENSAVITNLVRLAVVGFVVGLLGFIALVRYGEIIKGKLVGLGRCAEWVNRRLIDTLSCLRNGRKLVWVMAVSLLVWIFEASSFSALMVHWGVADYVPAGWFVMGVVNLSILLPSAPGHMGVYHWAVVLALGVLAVPGTDAVSFAVVIHALQWLSITVIGVFFMLFLVGQNRSNDSGRCNT